MQKLDLSELPEKVELTITISPEDYRTLIHTSGMYDSGIVGHILTLYREKAKINKDHKIIVDK